MERIDELVYQAPAESHTREGEETTLFLTGPAEFLCKQIAAHLRADEVWSKLFGDFIDPYKRMDYSMRNLPAIRIYNNGFKKDYESWFINGMVTLDLIFPASIRRMQTEQIPDTLCAAILQQFRRPTFFGSLCQKVPGLNELGKTVDCDKALAFEFEDELVPLIQILVNFRIDLREWDDYLESDYRTTDDPFSRPLGDLTTLVTTMAALRDDGSTELEIQSEQFIDNTDT